MALLQMPVVVALIWVIAVLATIWALGPGIGFLVARGPLLSEVDADPRAAEPGDADRAYADRARQLMALGFRPVGRSIEKMRFFTPAHWSWRSDGCRWLASPEGDLFVGMFRVAGADPLRTTAVTLFEGGGVVETAVSKAGLEVDLGDLGRRVEVDGDDLGQLLARHRRHVEVFTQLRAKSVKRATLSEVGAAMVQFEQRVVPKSRLAGMYGPLCFFVMPLFAALRMHLPARSPLAVRPLAICTFVLMFAVIRWAILPGRAPKVVKMAVMVLVLLAPMFVALRFIDRRQAARSPDPSAAVGRTNPSR